MNCRMQRFLYWDQSTSATFPQSFVGAWVGLRLIKFINGLSGRLVSRDKPSKMGDSKHWPNGLNTGERSMAGQREPWEIKSWELSSHPTPPSPLPRWISGSGEVSAGMTLEFVGLHPSLIILGQVGRGGLGWLVDTSYNTIQYHAIPWMDGWYHLGGTMTRDRERFTIILWQQNGGRLGQDWSNNTQCLLKIGKYIKFGSFIDSKKYQVFVDPLKKSMDTGNQIELSFEGCDLERPTLTFNFVVLVFVVKLANTDFRPRVVEWPTISQITSRTIGHAYCTPTVPTQNETEDAKYVNQPPGDILFNL